VLDDDDLYDDHDSDYKDDPDLDLGAAHLNGGDPQREPVLPGRQIP
jgi:hypothetical protein